MVMDFNWFEWIFDLTVLIDDCYKEKQTVKDDG